MIALIITLLSDCPRSGTPNFFSTEPDDRIQFRQQVTYICQQKILDFIAYYNHTMAKPFVWKFEGYPEVV